MVRAEHIIDVFLAPLEAQEFVRDDEQAFRLTERASEDGLNTKGAPYKVLAVMHKGDTTVTVERNTGKNPFAPTEAGRQSIVQHAPVAKVEGPAGVTFVNIEDEDSEEALEQAIKAVNGNAAG